MLWKSGSGAVTPQAVVTEAVTQELMVNSEATRTEVTDNVFPVMEVMFGSENVTERGVHDQVCSIFGVAQDNAVNGKVDVLSYISLALDYIPNLENVHLVYWTPQNGVNVYFQRVASRLYGTVRPPWNYVKPGDIVIGKMAQKPVFGFTVVEQAVYHQVVVPNTEELDLEVAKVKDYLAGMAVDIEANSKLLVEDTADSQAYWGGTAKFAEKKRGGLVSHASLFTFEPWQEFTYPIAQEKAGTCFVDFKVGQGPASSWWAGGPIVASLSSNCTWKPPKKRGRKTKVEVEVEVTE